MALIRADPSDSVNKLEASLLSSPKLPDFKGVRELMTELEELDETDVVGIESVISSDGDLSREVLRLVNNPVYGRRRKIDSLQEAVVIVGVSPLRNLCLALWYVSRFRSHIIYRRGVDFLWQTSLMTGIAARQMATLGGRWDGEEAFLAGLMADCAVPVMYRTVPGYRDIIERFRLGEGDLIDIERESLTTDHARLADLFLANWGFPDPLRVVLSAQHDPELMGLDVDLLHQAQILGGAWDCARALTVPGYSWQIRSVPQHVAEILEISVAGLKNFTMELRRRFKKTAEIMDIPAELEGSS